MRLPEICIRQPVFAIVLSLVLVVVGVVSFMRLGLRFFPELNVPLMTINTSFPGADPTLIENSITTPLENVIAGVPNIAAMNSSSSASSSSIQVRFYMGKNFSQEVNSVRDKVSAERESLPTNAEPPVIQVGTVGQTAVNIDFLDPGKTPAEIRDYVESYVQPVLQQVKGVGSVSIQGASDYAMRIWLNSAKMAALGVTVPDIETALQDNNINFPAGQIQGPIRNYTIISDTALKTPQQFGDIIIRIQNGRAIRFKDLADVELGYSSLQPTPMRVNGVNAVDAGINPLLSASPIEVADGAKTVLKKIRQSLPPGMKSIVSYDASIFLKSSIRETFIAIIEAIILVVIVVFLFLGSVRASCIPIVTIPVCIIAVFGVMYLFGFTVNVMTLLAVVLAIGLVVDDAVVMLENIHRHIEEGQAPLQAAIVGSKEIAFSVVAMTLTLAAVYAPIGFAQGFTAVIFKEFAFTLAGAVIISGFVALTLSPMMCAKILQPRTKNSRFATFLDQRFEKISSGYQTILAKLLRTRLLIVGILIVLAILGYLMYRALPSEFVPKEDVGLIEVQIEGPSKASINYMNKYTKRVENIVKKVPAVKDYLSFVGGQTSQTWLVLKRWGKRELTTQDVVNEINPKLEKITGVKAFATVPDPVQYGMGGHDYAIHLMTTGSYDQLLGPMAKMYQLLQKYPGLTQVDRDLKFDAQEYKVDVNRDLAGAIGVNIQDIATTLSAMLGGAHITDIYAGTRTYEVKLQMPPGDLKNFAGIRKLYVRSATNKLIPLSNLITLTPSIGAPSLSHYNRMRAGTITAQLQPGYSISQAIDYTFKVLPQVLTPNVTYAFDGRAQEFVESEGGMTGIFLMSFIFIYLVLSAQFGSFIDPFIILLSVPLSIVGALFALILGGGTLNLYSDIGLVTLVGLITKHGILITQFANELRGQGMELYQAVIKAARIRLRPILMTTIAMIFGTLPLALATGPGSIGRHQIGWVIVGGLIFGTFFSLVVVPIAYTYLGRFKKFAPPQ